MSKAFSDDLSSATPSECSAPSSPPAGTTNPAHAVAVRGKKGAKRGGRGAKRGVHSRTNSGQVPTLKGNSHSRTTSQSHAQGVRSATHSRNQSQSLHTNAQSHSQGHSNSNHSRSRSGSASGSDLSPVPSEKGHKGEEDDDNEDEEDEDGGRYAPKGRGAGIHLRATRQSSARGPRGGRVGRGVVPAGMWEWATKKKKKAPTPSEEDEENEDGSQDEKHDDAPDASEHGDHDDAEEGTEERDAKMDVDEERHSAASDEEDEEVQGAVLPSQDQDVASDMDGDQDHEAKEEDEEPHETQEGDEHDDEEDPDVEEPDREGLIIPTVKVEPPSGRGFGKGKGMKGSKATTVQKGKKGSAKSTTKIEAVKGKKGKKYAKKTTRVVRRGKGRMAIVEEGDEIEEHDREADEGDDHNVGSEVHDADENEGTILDHEEEAGEEGEDAEEGEEVQPSDRLEAIEVLAGLELKFALLRGRIFKERMEDLFKEEEWIRSGVHPELLHTYAELDKRREKRVHLAELKRKRDLDLAFVTRKAEEDCIWNWWMVEKDHLQAELITEGSRKRRKIERQRRALLDTFKPTIDGPTEPPKERGRGRARKEEGPDKEKEEEEPVLSLKQVVKVALKHPYARLPTAPTANKPVPIQPTLSTITAKELEEDMNQMKWLLMGGVPGLEDAPIPGFPPSTSNVNGTVPGSTAPSVNGVSSTGAGFPTTATGSAINAPPGSGYSTAPGTGPTLSLRPPSAFGAAEYRDVEMREVHDGANFSDHRSAHQRSSAAPIGVNGTTSRRRERDVEVKQRYSGGSTGYGRQEPAPNYPNHQSANPYPNTQVAPHLSPIPVTRERERERDPMIQALPQLPPAPSTVPSSAGGRGHHHLPPSSAGASHPSLVWERRDDGPATGARERSASMTSGVARERETDRYLRDVSTASGGQRHQDTRGPTDGHTRSHGHHHHSHHSHPHSTGVIASSRDTNAGSGRAHSHSHNTTGHHHYPLAHTHTHGHAHTHHTHHGHSHSLASHSHPHGQHLHVIHDHGPTQLHHPAPGTSAVDRPPSSGNGNVYPVGAERRNVDRERDRAALERERERERERDRNIAMHPSLSRDSALDRHAYSSQPPLPAPPNRTGSALSGPRRDSWEEGRERSRDASSYSRYYGTAGVPPTSGGTQYSPTLPGKRSSPPPVLPPVPNTASSTSRFGLNIPARSSPVLPPPSAGDVQEVDKSAIAVDRSSPTSSLNAPGFNPWSAAPAPRPAPRYKPPSPAPQINGSKVTPPLPSSGTSGPTLSPILSRPPQAPSPVPGRPSVSPAPRPRSSSSIHAILAQPATQPPPSASFGMGSKSPTRDGGEAMEVDGLTPAAPGHT